MDSSNCTCQELINKNPSYDFIKHCEQKCIIIITFIVINNQIKEMGHLNSITLSFTCHIASVFMFVLGLI